MSTIERLERELTSQTVDVLLFPPRKGTHAHLPREGRPHSPRCQTQRGDYQEVPIKKIDLRRRHRDGQLTVGVAGFRTAYKLCSDCFRHAEVDLPPRFAEVIS